jgi:hypothetical protein
MSRSKKMISPMSWNGLKLRSLQNAKKRANQAAAAKTKARRRAAKTKTPGETTRATRKTKRAKMTRMLPQLARESPR